MDLDFERLLGRLGFRHLRMILAIAEAKHLVGAAKRLNMTQSAVTKSLQDVEALLRVTLFERRSNRGANPTIYGIALIAHSRLVLNQLSHAAEEIADLRDGTGGRVAVGTLLAASANLLPTAVATLRKERPKVAVSIVESTGDILMPALADGELDLVVGRLSDVRVHAGLHQEALLSDVACVVARPSHPLADAGPLTLAELAPYDWILPTTGTTLRQQIDRAFDESGTSPPHHCVESVSLLTNRRLIAESDTLAVLPWQTAHIEARDGRLVILPVPIPTTAGPLGITTRRDVRLAPAADELIAAIRVAARAMPECPFLPPGLARRSA